MLVRKQAHRAIVISLSSRALVFLFQLFFNIFIPDHKSQDAFRAKVPRHVSFLDRVVGELFPGLNHWDSQHFIHVTEKGYDSEDKLVFLPLFPLSLRVPAHLIHCLSGNYFNTHTSVILSGFVMNTAFFTLAAVAVYELTLLIFTDKRNKYAEEAVLWFSFNPASIFFSATYSESLFSLLTFAGLSLLEAEYIIPASVLFALSAMTRSNGLVNAGFIIYFFIRIIADTGRSRTYKVIMCVKIPLAVVLVILPFYLYQKVYIPGNFCPEASFCSVMAGGSFLSIPYTHLQEKYWNQGFLRYWQWRQSHNFLIGLPIILLNMWSSFRYLTRIKDMLFHNKVTLNENRFWSHPRLVPYAVHVTFLAVYCLFFMHIQVAVRLISSSSPWIYWMAAALETNSRRHDITRYLFTSYFFMGIALFANGLTWT